MTQLRDKMKAEMREALKVYDDWTTDTQTRDVPCTDPEKSKPMKRLTAGMKQTILEAFQHRDTFILPGEVNKSMKLCANYAIELMERVDENPEWFDGGVKGNTCDECESIIPNRAGGSLDNKHHAQWCSLYDPRKE